MAYNIVVAENFPAYTERLVDVLSDFGGNVLKENGLYRVNKWSNANLPYDKKNHPDLATIHNLDILLFSSSDAKKRARFHIARTDGVDVLVMNHIGQKGDNDLDAVAATKHIRSGGYGGMIFVYFQNSMTRESFFNLRKAGVNKVMKRGRRPDAVLNMILYAFEPSKYTKV